MITIKSVINSIFAMVIGSSALAHATPFVRAEGTKLTIDGQPYQFMGTNFWYGINLGSPSAYGDYGRLVRELDRLKAMGIDNLRVMAASEGPNNAPYRMSPALQTSPGVFDQNLLIGLDVLLAEMQKRGMYAIMVLGNYWQWSGGFAQYVSWVEGSSIPYPEQTSWTTFENYSAKFYALPEAVQLYHNVVDLIVTRKNSVTGVAYANDPTIMAWELANEPRGHNQYEHYLTWVQDTARRIKRLDSNHLVTTGSEGLTAAQSATNTKPEVVHALKDIDYLTFHLWIQNFGWYEPRDPNSYNQALARAVNYVNEHVAMADNLGKPSVFEEFGIARDGGDFSPLASTATRDHYYRAMFQATLDAVKANRAVSGVNFWAWGGEGKPVNPGGLWQLGQPFTGDPPHEPQGWYSVYDHDKSTIDIIKEFAGKLKN